MNFQLKFKEQTSTQKISDISTNRTAITIILDNVKNPANIGMIFRIADAIRAEKIILYFETNQHGVEKFVKSSRSTEKYVNYQIVTNFLFIEELKNTHQIIALEKTNNSIDYQNFLPKDKIALIIGSENFGVSEQLLKIVEQSIHLPMLGVNTSINVATASSVVLYDILLKMNKI